MILTGSVLPTGKQAYINGRIKVARVEADSGCPSDFSRPSILQGEIKPIRFR